MEKNSRKYSGDEDLLAMTKLAQACPGSNIHLADLPYRLSSWAVDEPENGRLWMDEQGRLAGWAVLQTPFWTVDLVLGGENEVDLFRLALDWADKRAGQVVDSEYGHRSWFVNVFADQTTRRAVLEAAGFKSQAVVGEDSWRKVLLERKGDTQVGNFRIPAGFTIRPLKGEMEAEAYVDLHREVFESKNMTTAWRRRVIQSEGYHPELDLVAEAPDGELAAFCIAWVCEVGGGNKIGQIEPLGCRADFRKYGLGRLVLAEALRRLQTYGVEQIVVETDDYRNTALRLYQAMGFFQKSEILVYRKDYVD